MLLQPLNENVQNASPTGEASSTKLEPEDEKPQIMNGLKEPSKALIDVYNAYSRLEDPANTEKRSGPSNPSSHTSQGRRLEPLLKTEPEDIKPVVHQEPSAVCVELFNQIRPESSSRALNGVRQPEISGDSRCAPIATDRSTAPRHGHASPEQGHTAVLGRSPTSLKREPEEDSMAFTGNATRYSSKKVKREAAW